MAVSALTKQLTDSLEGLLSGDEWITAREVHIRGCDGVPDIVAVRRRQYLRKELRAYEVKASRSDYLSDVGQMKWRKYLSVCHRVYFAAPAGMLKRSEIPEGAGLIVFSDRGWSVVKTAKSHTPTELDADAVLSILFSANSSQIRSRDIKERLVSEGNITIKGVADKIGGEIARRVAGCTPETESDASRIMNVVNKYFGNDVDAARALRFAASLAKEVDVVAEMSTFLKNLVSSVSPEAVEQSAKKLKIKRRKHKKSDRLILDTEEIGNAIDMSANSSGTNSDKNCYVKD